MLQRHEFNFFPEMDAESYAALKSSISNGFDANLGKIVLYGGKILDGWNRYRACMETDVQPQFTTFVGEEDEALRFSIRANQERRHLSKSQLAAIAVQNEELINKLQAQAEERRRIKISNTLSSEKDSNTIINNSNAKWTGKLISPSKKTEAPKKTAIVIAEMFGTNQQYIKNAKRLKESNPEAFAKVVSGETTITEAKRELKREEQKQQVAASRISIPVSENIKHGDCLEILETLADGCVDIVLTDPPYGINYISNRSVFDDAITKRGLENDSPNAAFWLLDKTCEVLSRKTAENAHLYFFCGWSVYCEFRAIISNHFKVKTTIVWDKGNKGSGDLEDDWGNQTELIIFCTKGKKTINYRRGNLISVPRLHSSKMIHPTQKPEGLLRAILEVSAVEGDFVVDPFMGSGSTIKVCKDMGLDCLGVELDGEMFNIANSFINE